MRTHHFTLHMIDPPDLWERFDELVERFWADGANDDTSPGMSEGHMEVDFHREAATLSDAVRSAVASVRAIGLEVDRVEIHRRDLARLLGEPEPSVASRETTEPSADPAPLAAVA